jgi:hypothetical protein
MKVNFHTWVATAAAGVSRPIPGELFDGGQELPVAGPVAGTWRQRTIVGRLPVVASPLLPVRMSDRWPIQSSRARRFKAERPLPGGTLGVPPTPP